MQRLAAIEQAHELGLALELERQDLAPGEQRQWRAADGGEGLVYVIAGGGEVTTPDGRHPLAAETIVWLPAGEGCTLVAGEDGLAILATRAPLP